MTTEAWKTVEVWIEPFARAPLVGKPEDDDDPFVKIAEGACGCCGPDWWTWEVSVSACEGVVVIGFFDDEETGVNAPSPDEAAGLVARLLAELEIEAADIYGRVTWTVMVK